MRTRIVLGAVMIIVIAALLYLDWWLEAMLRDDSQLHGLPTAVVLLALVIVGFCELVRLSDAAGVKLLGISGMLATAVLATFPYWHRLWPWLISNKLFINQEFLPTLILLSLALLAIFAEQMLRYRTEDALRRIGVTLLAVLYLGVGGTLILQLRMLDLSILVLFLAAVKCTDIGAYFTGSALGKHKMIPWLSPGKSWEGLFGGLLFAAGMSVLVVWLLDMHLYFAYWKAAVFGGIVGLAGQFGDLCESLLKRSAQVKDSGAALPQFGGVLDVIDSVLLAAPIAFLLLAILA